MSSESGRSSARAVHGLASGSELAGVELQQLVAADDFCCIWLTGPLEHVQAQCCIRAIPAGSTLSKKHVERFRSELAPWREQRGAPMVELFDCGWDAGYFYALMRYMPDGSLGARLQGKEPIDLPPFALRLADSLRRFHETIGPHGNLKPTNVFPTTGGKVLLSDPMLPLWCEQMEAGLGTLRSHLVHPYLAPEQRGKQRRGTTRSDVFSSGLVLLQCLTGAVPFLRSQPAEVRADWPDELRPVAERCLERNPGNRFASGAELYDAVCAALGGVKAPAPGTEADSDESDSAAPSTSPTGAGDVVVEDEDLQAALDQARRLVDENQLAEALDVIESLPHGLPGIEKLLDEIELRDAQAKEQAERGASDDADTLMEATQEVLEDMDDAWSDSELVRLVREELPEVDGEAGIEEGELPEGFEEATLEQTVVRLQEALRDGDYRTARPLLEKLLRTDPDNDQVARLANTYKLGRVRRAFRACIREARRAYLNGERNTAAHQWLEAARWLAPGPQRQRLREIADAAAAGTLVLHVDEIASVLLKAPDADGAPETAVPAEVELQFHQQRLEEERRARLRLLLVLGIFALIFGACFALMLALLS